MRAMPPPATRVERAVARFCGGVTATAIAGAIDQNSEWANATPIREAMSE